MSKRKVKFTQLRKDVGKSHVTHALYCCPSCGIVYDSGKLLVDKKCRKLYGKKTVVGHKLCSACFKEGFITLVVIDESKSIVKDGIVTPENAHRTGDIIHLRSELAANIFPDILPPLPVFMYVNTEVGNNIKDLAFTLNKIQASQEAKPKIPDSNGQ